MRQFNFWILLFLISFFSTALTAQCKKQIATRSTLDTRETTAILALIEQLEDCPALKDSLALSYHTLGTIYYPSELTKAIAATQKALELRRQISPQPLFHIARSSHNLGVFYNKTDRWDKAIQYLTIAKDIYDQLDTSRVSKSYRELADIADKKGDAISNMQLLRIAIQKAHSFSDTATLVNCYLDLSSALISQKKYREAIQKIKFLQELCQAYPYCNASDLASCQINLGAAYYQLQEYTSASFHYKAAIRLFEELENKVQLSKSWSNLSMVYLRQNNYSKALQAVEKALKIAQDENSPREISQSYNNLGEIYLAKKEFPKALRYYQQDANALIPQFDNTDYKSYPSKAQLNLVTNKIELLKSFKDKARGLKMYQQKTKDNSLLLQMLQTYECADYLVDLIRTEQNNQSSKLVWRENVVSMYEQAIQLCYTLKNTERAFYFFEKSKSILLLEGLLQAQALDIIPDSTSQKEFRLRNALLYAKEDLELASPQEQEKLLEEVVTLQERLRQLTQQIGKKHPQYFELKYQLEVASLSELKKNLTDQDVFLHFFSGQTDTYLLCVEATKESFIKIGNTTQLKTQLNRFLNFFQSADKIEQAPEAYATVAFEVYQQLIGQLELAENKNLIIVPDGLLNFVPFEALVQTKQFTNLGSLPYLIKQHPIRYSYSGTILQKQAVERTTGISKFLAFAPFAENKNNASYGNLNYSQDELSNIESQVAGTFLKNHMATKANFFQRAPKANIIHLSTHALANADSLQPRIVFADTTLLLSELYGLDLNAALVVLSACETNIGKIRSGEGVMSMARGFTYAGAKSQISSLWKVNAATTGKIFSDFYHSLIDKQPSAQAFHQAKLKHLNDPAIRPSQKSPYYWAGFIFLGPDRIISMPAKSAFPIGTLIIGISLLIFLWFLLSLFRQKKKTTAA
ncbi:MAG: CHAT domain-containing protein [Saprospiraceae bacterium]